MFFDLEDWTGTTNHRHQVREDPGRLSILIVPELFAVISRAETQKISLCLKTDRAGTTNNRHHVHKHSDWPSVLIVPVACKNFSCWNANLDDTLRQRRDVSTIEDGSWTLVFLLLIYNIEKASRVELAKAG